MLHVCVLGCCTDRLQGEVNSGGSGAEDVAAWRARSEAEAAVAAAQAAVQRGDKVISAQPFPMHGRSSDTLPLQQPSRLARLHCRVLLHSLRQRKRGWRLRLTPLWTFKWMTLTLTTLMVTLSRCIWSCARCEAGCCTSKPDQKLPWCAKRTGLHEDDPQRRSKTGDGATWLKCWPPLVDCLAQIC